jgi:two-component system chemotaxis sensor kinase CheA
MTLRYLTGGATTEALPASKYPIQEEQGQVDVIVYTNNGQASGIVVDEILDVLEEEFRVIKAARQASGATGTAVIRERVAEMVEIDLIASS